MGSGCTRRARRAVRAATPCQHFVSGQISALTPTLPRVLLQCKPAAARCSCVFPEPLLGRAPSPSPFGARTCVDVTHDTADRRAQPIGRSRLHRRL
eukprot:4293911-Pleurochrysis_carterae.AAC.1